MTRLQQTVEKDAKQITVNASQTLGWQVNDLIGIAGSSYSHDQQEIV